MAEITLNELASKTPKTDEIEIYKYNGWLIQNTYREKLINEKLKDCQRLSERVKEGCEDALKPDNSFEPIPVPGVSVKWYKTAYFGWSISFISGIGLGYLIFH